MSRRSSHLKRINNNPTGADCKILSFNSLLQTEREAIALSVKKMEQMLHFRNLRFYLNVL